MNLSALIKEFGPASQVIEIEEHALSPLKDGEIRIKMLVRSVNPSDLITISGAYRSRTQLPFYPGFEGIGSVVEIGDGVSEFRLGERVLPIHTAGAWQKYKVSDAASCLKVPKFLSDESAALSYVNPMTAWMMSSFEAKLKPGMRVAVTAAGSNIGQILIFIANTFGIVPFAFLRSDQAEANLAGLDAQIFRYETIDQLKHSVQMAGHNSVDVIFDCVGGPEASHFAKLLTSDALYLHYGLLSGSAISSAAFNDRPNVQYKMCHLRNWVHAVDISKVEQTYSELTELVGEKLPGFKVRQRYSLENIKDAILDAENINSHGKIVIIGQAPTSPAENCKRSSLSF